MATEIPRDDAEAALQARRELGKEYEPEIVQAFVDQLDDVIQERVEDVVSRRGESAELAKQQRKAESERSGQSLALAVVSMALAIPLTAIIASEMSSPGMIAVVWVAIVLINVSFTIGRRLR